MIFAGDTVIFDPFAEITGFASEDHKGGLFVGTVAMVNHEHKWFSVEYSVNSMELRTSFKFSQLGRDVHILKRHRCTFPNGVTIKPDGINPLDPCRYQTAEIHRNVTVEVRRCVRCGHVDVVWFRQEDTESEMVVNDNG